MMQPFKLAFFLMLFFVTKSTSQEKIYQLVLIETKGPLEERAFVLIDSLGIIKSQKNLTGEQLDLNNLSASVAKFLNQVEMDKSPASNNPNRKVRDPNGAEKCLNFYLIFLSDFYKETAFKNKSHYHFASCQPLDTYDVNKYPLFELLSNENALLIKKFLE